jgi:hypothetical protein
MSKKDSNILEIKLERVIKKSFSCDFNRDLKPIPNHPAAVSTLWSLPPEPQTPDYSISHSFGKMYVGESFTSSLRVANISQAVLERVVITCTLKYTNAKSVPLLFQAEVPRLFPDMSHRFAFTLNVDQPDVYFLNLQAHFSIKEITEPITVGKLFKFEAKPPIEFQSKSMKADEGFIVQARMTNQSIYEISIDSVEFVCGSCFRAIPYSAECDSEFHPTEVRSVLYHLYEVVPMPANPELGRVLVTWHNKTGDVGTLASAGIAHSYKYDKTLKMAIENKPKAFVLEEPTSLTLLFTNLTLNFTMEDVKIDIAEQTLGIIITPMAPPVFTKIKPQETVSLLCAAFPKIPGIHRLEGIRVFAGRKVLDFDSCTVCVKPS